jgi:signal transduction histidine kinase
MLRYTIIILFIGITTTLSGQPPHLRNLTDSLYQNWENENNNVEDRRENFSEYIWNKYLFVKPDSARILAHQLIDFCKKNDDLFGEGKGLNILAISYALVSDYVKATEIFQKNLEVYQQTQQTFLIGSTYNNIGNCYYEQAYHYQGLDYFNKALVIYNAMLDTCSLKTEGEVRVKMEKTYSTIIGVYIGLNELEKAREIYEKNLKNIRKIDKEIDASLLHGHIAALELLNKNYDLALVAIEKSIQEAERFHNKRTIGLGARVKGQIFSYYERTDSAIILLETAKRVFQEIGHAKGIADTKLLLADLWIKKKDFKKALAYLKEADDLANSKNLNYERSDVNKVFANYYKAIGNPTKAYQYLTKYHELKDSTEKLQNDKLLTSLEDKYAYESELSAQNLKIELEKAAAKKTRIILILVELLAAILAILTWRFFSLNKELKIQKGELVQQKMALNESLSQLEESNHNLKQFASAAAHDLKGPLRTISSFTNLINRRYRKLVKPEDTEYFDFILRGTTTMQELINGLLQYSSVSNKTFEVESVDLNEVFNDVILSLDTNIQEAKATINIQNNLPICNGQTTLLFQVFSNLINNAIKFRKKTEPLTINISHKLQSDDYQLITIKDNGIGIEEKYQGEVFKVFKKLHNATEYEGVGLGLSLSKKIIERFDGEIWLESEFGVGTTLFIKLKKN